MPTLLLSDDNLMVQRVIAMTFASEDITVKIVSDGEEAILQIASERPDVVLASISTPKRNGYEVAAFVKSSPGLASIPVLLLAGAFEPVDQARVTQVRCDGVIVKPFEPPQVVARVRELIASAGSRTSAPATGKERDGDSPVQSTPQGASGSPARTSQLRDDYFDRLDSAFAQRPAGLKPSATDDGGGVVPTLDAVLQSPASTASPMGAPLVTEAMVDEIARRVIERLGTDAVRGIVADVVADVAERLVREEIARIRQKGYSH